MYLFVHTKFEYLNNVCPICHFELMLCSGRNSKTDVLIRNYTTTTVILFCTTTVILFCTTTVLSLVPLLSFSLVPLL